eukprot:gene9440-19613_t
MFWEYEMKNNYMSYDYRGVSSVGYINYHQCFPKLKLEKTLGCEYRLLQMANPSFKESVATLIEDQTLFESSNYDQRHGTIIKCGGFFSAALKTFEESGEECVESLPLEQRQRVMNAINEYEALLLPPKAFLGCIPCGGESRNGVEYEKKLLSIHAKVVEATFILQVATKTYECDKINERGRQYSSYSSKLNSLANLLEGIVVKNNANARDEIKSALHSVEDFVNDFIANEMKESLAEANKRIRKTKDILNIDSGKEVTKRALVNAQANLQEILNSAASVTAARSKEKMDIIEKEIESIKESSEAVMGAYKDLEEPMSAQKMEELLESHKLYAEDLGKTIHNKLNTIKKQWKTIRGQATYRPVAVYEMEMEDLRPSVVVANVGAGVNSAADGVAGAANAMAGAASGGVNLAGKVGFKAASIAVQAVSAPTKAVTSAGSQAVKGVAAGVNATVSAATHLPNAASKMFN